MPNEGEKEEGGVESSGRVLTHQFKEMVGRIAGKGEETSSLRRSSRIRAGVTLEEALGDWSMRSGSETEVSRGKRLFSELSDTEDPETCVMVEKRPGVAKRGRARGAIAKVTSAKQALRSRAEEAREAEFVASLEKTKFRKAAAEAEIPPGPLDLDVDRMGADELVNAAEANLQEILGIAGKSTNLKGGYVSKIRRATGSVKEVLEALMSRTEAEETRRLRADNARLRREIANLREEVRAYRRDFEEAKVAAKSKRDSSSPMSNEQLGILEANIARMVGNLVDGRLAALEDRLPPSTISRPPLASDGKRAASEQATRAAKAVVHPTREVSPVLQVRPQPENASRVSGSTQKRSEEEFPALSVRAAVRSGLSSKGGKKGGKWTSFGPASLKAVQMRREVAPAVPATSTAPTDSWTEVVKRKVPKQKPAKTVATEAPTKKGVKLFLPTSSAVIIKLRPEAVSNGETYGSVLTRAQKRLNLEELGIGPLRLKVSATGARLIEVPGRDSAAQADALANKMGDLLSEVADVVRPVKKTDFKLTGLDETATRESVKAAVAAEGGCDLREVWVGDLQFDERGVGMVKMSCPLLAAKHLIDIGAIRVGWSMVRLHHQGARPRHCYRCLGLGHTSELCQAEKDRSGLCYRCGEPGHKAVSCGSSRPHCAVCTDAGKKADHVMGGRACHPPTVRGKLPSSLRPPGRGPVAHDAEMSE